MSANANRTMKNGHGIETSGLTKRWLGRVVGAVRIVKPVEIVDKSYECAAWWEARKSATGTFPLVLRAQHHYPHTLYLEAVLPAVVTDDHFPALWGGVAISTKPTEAKNIGDARTMRVSIELLEAIRRTGNSADSKDRDLFVDPTFWTVLLAEVRSELARAMADLPRYAAELEAGEDEFFSRVGMVAHVAEKIADLGRASAELQRCLKYDAERPNSAYRQGLWSQNTAWAQNFLLSICPLVRLSPCTPGLEEGV